LILLVLYIASAAALAALGYGSASALLLAVLGGAILLTPAGRSNRGR
jgi:hypothetical protein